MVFLIVYTVVAIPTAVAFFAEGMTLLVTITRTIL